MGASFKDLIVWQKAIQLSAEVYRLTAAFPKAEQFGLTNQMRRASVSIASNIARRKYVMEIAKQGSLL